MAACRVFVCESYSVWNEPGYGCASFAVQRETFWCLELIIAIPKILNLIFYTMFLFVCLLVGLFVI